MGDRNQQDFKNVLTTCQGIILNGLFLCIMVQTIKLSYEKIK